MIKLNYEYLFEKGIDKQEASEKIINLFDQARQSKKGYNELVIKMKQGLTLPLTINEFLEYVKKDRIYFAEMFEIIDKAKPRDFIIKQLTLYLNLENNEK